MKKILTGISKTSDWPYQINFESYLVTSSMADFESGINVVVAAAWYRRLHSPIRRMKFDVLRKDAITGIALDY